LPTGPEESFTVLNDFGDIVARKNEKVVKRRLDLEQMIAMLACVRSRIGGGCG
jgi:hypothetical protein